MTPPDGIQGDDQKAAEYFSLAAEGRVWRQSLTAEEVSPAVMRDELHRVQLTLETLDPDATRWLHARRSQGQ